MSRNRKSQNKVDLKLNLSLQAPTRGGTSSRRSSAEEASSPSSSCLSSEAELGTRSPDSPEAAASMVVAGCPRCLMYVMLSEDDLRCPKCRSTVLLDFCGDGAAAAKKSKQSGKKKRMS
ncbi:hypothetical protein Cni_G21515 [Canna indica]|uniref:GIR1-like zinc ribbon domain-containing protein n=1 Tax=Canna indica TaxID=4628 RepID=A0AAQ3QKD5_9LILI|nr:hypothetical protein Cni_G21515 [Canna indica]